MAIPAVFLRVWHIDSLGVNSDEAVYAGQAASLAADPELSPFFPIFRAHPLLFQGMLSVVYHVGGVSTLAGRLMSAAFGLGTVALLYFIGRLLYDRRVGFVAALIGSVMPYLVIVNRQILLDGPMTFFCHSFALPYGSLRPDAATRLAVRSGQRPRPHLPCEGDLDPAAFRRVRLLGPYPHDHGTTAPRRHRYRDLFRHHLGVSSHGYALGGQQHGTQLPGVAVTSTAQPLVAVLPLSRPGGARYTCRDRRDSGPVVPQEALILAGDAPDLVDTGARNFLRDLGGQGLPVPSSCCSTGGHPCRPSTVCDPAQSGDPAVEVTRIVLCSNHIDRFLVAGDVFGQDPSRHGRHAFLAGTGGVPGGREAGQWIDANVPKDSQMLALGPSMANIIQFYGHRKTYALSVSPNPLHRNPVYEPVNNPDLAIRHNNLQYIVWDSFSAERSPFFSDNLMKYTKRYHGQVVHASRYWLIPRPGRLRSL